MCGICGILELDRDRRVSPSRLASMNQQIVHRGPDDSGEFFSENVGLAMRRLSIIDLRTGHQPVSNEDETVWIVYNGEIYNHAILRQELQSRGHKYRTQSDTETIVHLYEEFGPDCVKRLRGMFAFAIWDKRKRRLFVARDRLGIKPFYYRLTSSEFLFGSEIKTLLAVSDSRPALNRSVLSEYLAFGYTSGDQTMFAGVKKLLPGHWLEIDSEGGVHVNRYWDLEPGQAAAPADGPEVYRYHLENAVVSHLMSDVPVGVFLSGGIDSSAVAALMAKHRSDKIKTFSVGYSEGQFSELGGAREVARHIGSEHHDVQVSRDDFFGALPRLIWHEDEPICWPSSVSLYFVSKLASEHVKVVLTGEGSDETLAGYGRHAFTVWNTRLDRIYRGIMPGKLRAGVRNLVGKSGGLGGRLGRGLKHTFLNLDGRSWSSLYFDNFYVAFSRDAQQDLLTDGLRRESGDPYEDVMKVWERSQGDLLQRMLYTDCHTYLVELLMKQDNMSMAASIESRVPFLDHELVELAMRIPSAQKIRGLTGKHILKQAMHDLLPHSVLYQKKLGFPTPLTAWLAGPKSEETAALSLSSRSLDRGLFEQAAIQRLFDEHRSGKADHTDRLWRLLNLEIWHRVFLDGERSPHVPVRDAELWPAPTSPS